MILKSDKYTGIYRAIVVSNKDPLELGRIQVRIPFLHGAPTQGSFISDAALPYAIPCFPFASHDAGVFLLPETNSMVFIIFEDGDTSKPVYMGQMYSKGSNTPTNLSYTDSGMYSSTGDRLKKANTDDIPSGAYNKGIFKRFILFKSPKGSTIQVNDNDEQESLEFYDRAGQSFVMHSPISSDDNVGGVNNRGIFSVIKNAFKNKIKHPSILILKSLNKSILRFVSKDDYSCTDLVTVYKDIEAGLHVQVGKDNRVLLFYKDSKFEIDDGNINIESDTISLNAKSINMNADTIHSTSNIFVGATKYKTINSYTNTNDEAIMKGVD